MQPLGIQEANDMKAAVEQEVVGDLGSQHEHPAKVHTHDHYHVSHHHTKNPLAEFEHHANYHSHEHDHAAIRHGHSGRSQSNEAEQHDATSHMHDHVAPSGNGHPR
jgi:hypothetical protein